MLWIVGYCILRIPKPDIGEKSLGVTETIFFITNKFMTKQILYF